MEEIKFKKIYEDSIIPTQAHHGDAGWDLYAHDSAWIAPGQTVKIDTGIAMAIPANTFAGIYARSGLATKQGLRPANCVGVVDAGYRGTVIVALHNDSMTEQFVEAGTRIAQMIIQPYIFCNASVVDTLEDTERGNGGFGSSGK